MDGYGILVEWHLTREKPKSAEKNLSQCHLTYHKFHLDWSRIEPGHTL